MMKALMLEDNEKVVSRNIARPENSDNNVLVQIHAISLNHLDLFSYRGMAFAKRKLPIIVGAEGAGQVVEVGKNVDPKWQGKRVVIYAANVCGECDACLDGRENLCEAEKGIFGFHNDGLATEFASVSDRYLVEIPDNVSWEHAACSTVTFGTVVHMINDNAKLQKGESILVQAGGSGIGTAAIKIAKHIGATVYTTVSTEDKAEKARAIGADHVINYKTHNFAREIRKLTNKKGVDVVFEHVGVDTWQGSMNSLKVGGRLVTCGSTTGVETNFNLFNLFNRQAKIFGSFGSTKRNIREALDLMSVGVVPEIDTVFDINEYEKGLEKLRDRNVFGKVVLRVSA